MSKRRGESKPKPKAKPRERGDPPPPARMPTPPEIERVAQAARDLAAALRRAATPDCPEHLSRMELDARWHALDRLLRALDGALAQAMSGTRVRTMSAGDPRPGAWPPFAVAVCLGTVRRCGGRVEAWLERWDRADRRPPAPKGLVDALGGSAADLTRAVEGAEVERPSPPAATDGLGPFNLLLDLPDYTALSIADLADQSGLPHEALRRRITRLCKGWSEADEERWIVLTPDPSTHEPLRLFRLGGVRSILQDLARKLTRKTGAKRPSRKKL